MNDNSNDNRPVSRGYRRDEWENMSHAQRYRVYQERERIETARMVAAILREEKSQADDVSSITSTVPQG